MNDEKWHGRENEDEIGTGGIPAQPDGAAEGGGDVEVEARGPYGKVTFEGRQGIGCPNSRRYERKNITYGDAKEFAWDAFGFCGGNVAFYDQNGNFQMEMKSPLP